MKTKIFYKFYIYLIKKVIKDIAISNEWALDI